MWPFLLGFIVGDSNNRNSNPGADIARALFIALVVIVVGGLALLVFSTIGANNGASINTDPTSVATVETTPTTVPPCTVTSSTCAPGTYPTPAECRLQLPQSAWQICEEMPAGDGS